MCRSEIESQYNIFKPLYIYITFKPNFKLKKNKWNKKPNIIHKNPCEGDGQNLLDKYVGQTKNYLLKQVQHFRNIKVIFEIHLETKTKIQTLTNTRQIQFLYFFNRIAIESRILEIIPIILW